MKNIENNKLIAEFMGAEKTRIDGLNKDIYFPVNGKSVYDNKMEYHSSWDWLMPVVQKINVIDDYSYTIQIMSMDVEIYKNFNNKTVFQSECKWQPDELLQSVYEAVVEFINWYNKNN